MKHRFHPALPGAILGVALILAACQLAGSDGSEPVGSAASPPRTPVASASAEATPSAEPSTPQEGEETSVFDLEPGDCFSASSQELESVTVVDCGEPHVYEVFDVFDHEASAEEAYPGDEAILDYADGACQTPFEAFVGIDYQSSKWYITSVTPSEETWAEGDREIVCTLNLEDESPVTGSAQDSGE